MSQRSPLRVVHVSDDVSAVAGGVPAVIRQLSERLAQDGTAVQIVHANGNPGNLTAGVEIYTFPPTGVKRAWAWGSGLRQGVAELATADGAVFHIHGVWSAPQYFAARAAHAAGTPLVVTPHGMLDPWLWNKQGWKKYLKKNMYWAALGYPALSKARVIHALTPRERAHLSKLFPQNRIEVIPNAIDLDVLDERPDIERSKTILFLGRIEPKKGVDVLLRAFAHAKIGRDWSVDVVGPVWSLPYFEQLKTIVKENGLTQRVRFHGPLFDDEKTKLIDAAWVMAGPSHSEGLSLVNLEAAARLLPSITTHQAGLDDWETGGGLLIDPEHTALRQALEQACSWTADEQRARGQASRLLVEQRYSWETVLPQWIELYSSFDQA